MICRSWLPLNLKLLLLSNFFIALFAQLDAEEFLFLQWELFYRKLLFILWTKILNIQSLKVNDIFFPEKRSHFPRQNCGCPKQPFSRITKRPQSSLYGRQQNFFISGTKKILNPFFVGAVNTNGLDLYSFPATEEILLENYQVISVSLINNSLQ